MTETPPPLNFHTRAKRAIIEYAFLRWESAVIIALTILLTVVSFLLKKTGIVPSWTWIVWLVFGTVSEALLIYVSLTDAETNRRVLNQLLQEACYPHRLENKRLQQKVDKAFDYYSRIQSAIHKGRDRLLANNLRETVEQVSEWLKNIYYLAQRIDRYQLEAPAMVADRNQVSERLRELKQQLKTESNTGIKQQLQATIQGMRLQLEMMDNLESTMEQANLKLEHTLSALGTIYSQTLLVEAKDIDSSHAQRLREEISEEMNGLNDLLAAMDKVYKD